MHFTSGFQAGTPLSARFSVDQPVHNVRGLQPCIQRPHFGQGKKKGEEIPTLEPKDTSPHAGCNTFDVDFLDRAQFTAQSTET